MFDKESICVFNCFELGNSYPFISIGIDVECFELDLTVNTFEKPELVFVLLFLIGYVVHIVLGVEIDLVDVVPIDALQLLIVIVVFFYELHDIGRRILVEIECQLFVFG